ncbi:MAG: redoxin domain-containing protein [Acidobacteriota bacterium]|nr:redoxin domain-containing protein [Acidobacteriota bacterium]
MRLIQVFCCSFLVIGSSCQGPSTPDPETARKLYQEAKSLDRDDDADRMLELYRQAVEHDPEYTEAHWEIISLTDDRERLRQDYARRVREIPNSAVLHYLLGEVSEGDTKRTQYEMAIELDPHYPWGYVGLGQLLEDLGSFDEAIENYQKMISQLPDEAEGYWGLLRTYKKAGRTDEAAGFLRQIYERFRNDPDEGSRALYQIADSLEDPTEKARLWHRYIEDYPSDILVTRVHGFLLQHYVKTDPEAADAFARECLLKEEPPNDRTLRNYAYRALFDLYWKMGEAQKEGLLAQELLESGYPNANAYTHVARHYAKEGRVELAVRFFRRALDFADPDHVHGTLLRSIGKPRRESLEKISRLARADISYELGQVLNKELRHREAIAVLRPVVGMWDPLGDRIHFELAAAYEATGQHQEALKHYASSLIDYLHDFARKPLENLFAKVHGSTEGLRQYVLDHVIQEETAGDVAIGAPTSLSLDETIIRARGLSSGKAPEFNLETLGGERVKSADLLGKVVVLDFWATWCGPCLRELPLFQATVDRWSDRPEVAFLAVSVDSNDDKVRRFMKDNEYDFPVVRDREVSDDFGVSGYPTIVIIGREGRIQYRHVGFDPDVDLIQKLSDKIDYLLGAGVS